MWSLRWRRTWCSGLSCRVTWAQAKKTTSNRICICCYLYYHYTKCWAHPCFTCTCAATVYTAGIQQWTGADVPIQVTSTHSSLQPSTTHPWLPLPLLFQRMPITLPKQIWAWGWVNTDESLSGWHEEKAEITIQRDYCWGTLHAHATSECSCYNRDKQQAINEYSTNHTTSWILTSEALVSEWKEDKAGM